MNELMDEWMNEQRAMGSESEEKSNIFGKKSRKVSIEGDIWAEFWKMKK